MTLADLGKREFCRFEKQGQDVQSRVEQGRQSVGWEGPAWSGSLRDAVKAAVRELTLPIWVSTTNRSCRLR